MANDCIVPASGIAADADERSPVFSSATNEDGPRRDGDDEATRAEGHIDDARHDDEAAGPDSEIEHTEDEIGCFVCSDYGGRGNKACEQCGLRGHVVFCRRCDEEVIDRQCRCNSVESDDSDTNFCGRCESREDCECEYGVKRMRSDVHVRYSKIFDGRPRRYNRENSWIMPIAHNMGSFIDQAAHHRIDERTPVLMEASILQTAEQNESLRDRTLAFRVGLEYVNPWERRYDSCKTKLVAGVYLVKWWIKACINRLKTSRHSKLANFKNTVAKYREPMFEDDHVNVKTIGCLKYMLDQITAIANEGLLVGVDLEGSNLGRYGDICVLQLAEWNTGKVFLVDIWHLNKQAFTTTATDGITTLQSILESSEIKKLFWDVRQDSDAIFAQYGIKLDGVIDLQLLRVRLLCCDYRMKLGVAVGQELSETMTTEELKYWQDNKSQVLPYGLNSWKVIRPLTPEMKRYAVGDVSILLKLYRALEARITDTEM